MPGTNTGPKLFGPVAFCFAYETFFWSHPWHMEFPGLGSNPSLSCDPRHSCYTTRSFTHCTKNQTCASAITQATAETMLILNPLRHQGTPPSHTFKGPDLLETNFNRGPLTQRPSPHCPCSNGAHHAHTGRQGPSQHKAQCQPEQELRKLAAGNPVPCMMTAEP